MTRRTLAFGGGWRIRTSVPREEEPHFECGALDHSANPPDDEKEICFSSRGESGPFPARRSLAKAGTTQPALRSPQGEGGAPLQIVISRWSLVVNRRKDHPPPVAGGAPPRSVAVVCQPTLSLTIPALKIKALGK